MAAWTGFETPEGWIWNTPERFCTICRPVARGLEDIVPKHLAQLSDHSTAIAQPWMKNQFGNWWPNTSPALMPAARYDS